MPKKKGGKTKGGGKKGGGGGGGGGGGASETSTSRSQTQEKEAKNLLKELRKADKNQRKVRARIIAVENRLDEADELGQISSDSESEEEWSDDEEDFYLGDMTVEQLKAKQEELKVTLDDIIQLKKDHIYKLIQLTEELPELRFHPKLKPAVAAFQRERIAAAKEREQALQAASSAASP